jgi:hypothetical protein
MNFADVHIMPISIILRNEIALFHPEDDNGIFCEEILIDICDFRQST